MVAGGRENSWLLFSITSLLIFFILIDLRSVNLSVSSKVQAAITGLW